MAIYHLSQQVISRAAGRSAVNAAAYRSASNLKDERLGQHFSYKNKKGVIHAELIAPENASDELKRYVKNQDRGGLWNAVERAEDLAADRKYKGSDLQIVQRIDRKLDVLKSEYDENPSHRLKEEISFLKTSRDGIVTNSWNAQSKAKSIAQSAFELNVALPIELTKEQGIALARDFVQERFVANGMIADLAVHWNEGNPHFHVMTTMRELSVDGFGAKNRQWGSRHFLNETRAVWDQIANKRLQELGISARIDHRSYEAQGIQIAPTVHEGFQSRQMVVAGLTSDRVDHNQRVMQGREQLSLSQKVDAVLAKLDREKGVWTEKDAHLTVSKTFTAADIEEHNSIIHSLLSGTRIRVAGFGMDERLRFVSANYEEVEERLFNNAQELSNRSSVKVNEKSLSRRLRRDYAFLSEEQVTAVKHMALEGDLSLVVGRAGVGKTTMVKAVAQEWQADKHRVIGMSIAGIAVENLSVEADIEGMTLASYLSLDDQISRQMDRVGASHGRERKAHINRLKDLNAQKLKSGDVVVFDEAGMGSIHDIEPLITEANKVGAKVVLLGDDRQLLAIDAGAPFRAMIERYSHAEVLTNRRQKVEWMRNASMSLGDLKTGEALDAYKDNGRVLMSADTDTAIEDIANRFVAETQYKSRLIIAFENAEVDAINTNIIDQYQKAGVLRDVVEIEGMRLSENMRVVFTDNDRKGYHVKSLNGGRVGVNNGARGVIHSIADDDIQVKMDDGRLMSFDPKEYNSLQAGYAVTLHKSQGQTVDKAYVLASKYMDAFGTHTALTRHRHDAEIHIPEDKFSEYVEFVKSARRVSEKEMLADIRAQGKVAAARERVNSIRDIGRDIDALKDRINHSAAVAKATGKEDREALDAMWEEVNALYAAQADVATDILDNMKDHQTALSQARIDVETLEVISGKERRLTIAEAEAKERMAEYGNLVHSTSEQFQKMRAVDPLIQRHSDYADYLAAVEERDTIANLIATNKDQHRPFLRYTGNKDNRPVSWATIEKQAEKHKQRADRAELKSQLSGYRLSLFERLDRQRELNGEVASLQSAIMQEVSGGKIKTWAESKHYQTYTNLRNDRDGRAAQLIAVGVQDPSAFDALVEAVGVDGARLEKDAKAHDMRERVSDFRAAVDTGDHRKAGLLASEIQKDIKRHYPTIKEMNVPPRHIGRFARVNDREKTAFTLSAEANAARERVREYQAVHRAIGAAYSKDMNKTDQMRYDAMVALRGNLAHEISKSPQLHGKWIEENKVNPEKIERQAYQHVVRENVKSFVTARSEDRTKADAIAAEMAKDIKMHGPHLASAKVSFRDVFDRSREHEERRYAASMSPTEAALYQQAREYRRLRSDAGRSWATLKEWATQEGRDIKEGPGYKETLVLMRDRDAAAAKAKPGLEVRPEWKERLGIDDARLNKHVKRHSDLSEALRRKEQSKEAAREQAQQERKQKELDRSIASIQDPRLRKVLERTRKTIQARNSSQGESAATRQAKAVLREQDARRSAIKNTDVKTEAAKRSGVKKQTGKGMKR